MLGLKLATDPFWVNIAEKTIDEILIDHAYCEQKAASTCISLIVKYPNKKELVDEVYDIVNDRMKAIRVLATAKSAIRHNVGDRLHEIKCPTLIIWGKEDTVTPAFVADKFHSLIENTELHIFDECGHAPMWELPKQFNAVLNSFLERHPVQL